MADIIQILPDSVANQIAAGEVIQRPASVVKELVENSLDAGATEVTVIVKEAGRNLIQIIDNGFGMSETDARLSFERHATSKIRNANDLFSIRTMGFRGEALASIAAVAEVVLKTRKQENELGTELIIRGSEFISSNPVAIAQGCNFCIKNIFYNVPARRKFLKSNSTELRYIIIEFQRIALAFPQIKFSLIHNDQDIYRLQEANFKQRIVQLFGKNYAQNLVDINIETSIVHISGFIGKPEFSRKKAGEQFFFVNSRFMKHPYFHKAVMQSYEKILSPEHVPSYFINFEINPDSIDINIHPTKTEIKFEDERSIYQILLAIIKEGLGKFNVTPSLDFDTEPGIQIPVLKKNTPISIPQVRIDMNFNPFNNDDNPSFHPSFKSNLNRDTQLNWESLYQGFEKDNQKSNTGANLNDKSDNSTNWNNSFLQIRNRFILTPVKSGLMLIDQKRAHERILYEKYCNILKNSHITAQQNLYPQTLELTADDYALIMEISEDIAKLGFDIRRFGINTVIINGCPSEMTGNDPVNILREMLDSFKNTQGDLNFSPSERVAQSLSRASAIPYGKPLNPEEMRVLVDNLFACTNPNYSPSGKLVLSIIQIEEFERKLK